MSQHIRFGYFLSTENSYLKVRRSLTLTEHYPGIVRQQTRDSPNHNPNPAYIYNYNYDYDYDYNYNSTRSWVRNNLNSAEFYFSNLSTSSPSVPCGYITLSRDAPVANARFTKITISPPSPTPRPTQPGPLS